MLVSIAIAGMVASGCGSGTATGTGSRSAANPHLRGLGQRQVTPGSAASVARRIATRWAAAGASAHPRTTPIEYRTIDYTATVFSPGAPTGFTAFITTRRTTLVTPASAATIYVDNGARPRFATPTDQALWQAAGRPSLGQAATTGRTQIIPVGQFSFLPQGSTLTYRQAAALPATSARLAAVILDHLRPYAGHPSTGQPGAQAIGIPDRHRTCDRQGPLGGMAGRGLASWAAYLPDSIRPSPPPRHQPVHRLRRRPDSGQRRSRHRGDPRHRRSASAADAVVPACPRRHNSRIEHVPRRLSRAATLPASRPAGSAHQPSGASGPHGDGRLGVYGPGRGECPWGLEPPCVRGGT